MPQMSPLMWMIYPYVLVLVMLVFLTTLIKEDVEMWGESEVEKEVEAIMKW